MLTNLSTKELVGEFNKRSTKSIAGWKSSKQALIKKIEALPEPSGKKSGNGSAGPATVDAAATKPAKKAGEKVVKTNKAPAEKKAPRVTIAARVLALMKDGKGYDQILGTIKKEYPKARTTVTSLEWYTWKYNKEGLL